MVTLLGELEIPMKTMLYTLLLCFALATPYAVQANSPSEPPAQQTKPPKKEISKEKATKLAQQRYPGRVLKVKSESLQYRIRLMQTDGRIVNVIVDGHDGRVKREE